MTSSMILSKGLKLRMKVKKSEKKDHKKILNLLHNLEKGEKIDLNSISFVSDPLDGVKSSLQDQFFKSELPETQQVPVSGVKGAN